MNARDARVALAEARRLEERRLLAPGAYPELERKYSAIIRDAGPDAGQPKGLLALYAVGGVILGAAAIAFVNLNNLDGQTAGWVLLGFGVMVAAAGFVLGFFVPPLGGIGDALIVAGVGPTMWAAAYSGFCIFCSSQPHSPIPVLSTVALTAMVFAPWRRGLAPPFASAGLVVSLVFTILLMTSDAKVGTSLWLAGTLGLGTAVAAVGTMFRLPWKGWSLAVLSIALVWVVYAFADQTLGLHTQGNASLVALAVEAGLVGVAVALRERIWLVGAAIGLAIAALSFAFSVSLVFGVVALVMVGAGLVAAGFLLRNWFRDSGPRTAPRPPGTGGGSTAVRPTAPGARIAPAVHPSNRPMPSIQPTLRVQTPPPRAGARPPVTNQGPPRP